MSDECCCGHVMDEHDPEWGDCCVEDCGCIHFDAAVSESETPDD